MSKKRKPNGYWTLARCMADAKKYRTRSEWFDKSLAAYTAATRKGWREICCAHMSVVGSLYKRLVYALVFPDNAVYIGLTFNSNSRIDHHFYNTNHNTVLDHILKTNHIPLYFELTDLIDKDDVGLVERRFIEEFKSDPNVVVLNKKLGGGLGGKLRIWTLERCLEDALEYGSKKEWERNSAAYQTAHKNGWLDICCAHMKRPDQRYWTLEKCMKYAIKFETKTEWKSKSSGSYYAACNYGWLGACCAHMKKTTNNFWINRVQ